MKLLVIIFIFIGFGSVATSLVTFGISASTQAPIGFQNLSDKSSNVLAGLEFFVETANTWEVRWNYTHNLTFAIKYLEDYGNSSLVRQNYQLMVNDPEINFLLGPVTSELSLVAKSVTEPARRLLLGTDVGSARFYTGADFSFAVTSSPPRYATTILPEFRVRGIRRIILVVEQTPDQIDIAKGFVANAEDYNIAIVDQHNVLNGDTINDEFIRNITDTVELIRSLDSMHGNSKHLIDAVVITSYTNVGSYKEH